MSARKSSAPNESLAAQAIQQQCKLLRLPTVGAQFETLAKQAIRRLRPTRLAAGRAKI